MLFLFSSQLFDTTLIIFIFFAVKLLRKVLFPLTLRCSKTTTKLGKTLIPHVHCKTRQFKINKSIDQPMGILTNVDKLVFQLCL